MRTTIIQPCDTPASLSARLGVPYCRILRANRLYSGAWLLPGREIEVPEGDACFCENFPCPAQAAHIPARDIRTVFVRLGDTVASVAKEYDMEEDELRRMNGFSYLWPGMRLLVWI